MSGFVEASRLNTKETKSVIAHLDAFTGGSFCPDGSNHEYAYDKDDRRTYLGQTPQNFFMARLPEDSTAKAKLLEGVRKLTESGAIRSDYAVNWVGFSAHPELRPNDILVYELKPDFIKHGYRAPVRTQTAFCAPPPKPGGSRVAARHFTP